MEKYQKKSTGEKMTQKSRNNERLNEKGTERELDKTAVFGVSLTTIRFDRKITSPNEAKPFASEAEMALANQSHEMSVKN
jgi:hypothetical protein